MPTLPGPSGAFVPKGRNRFSELRHIQLGADVLRRPFRPMQTRTPAKKAESTEEYSIPRVSLGQNFRSGSLASFCFGSLDVCLSPDRGGIADVPQPPLGAKNRLMRAASAASAPGGMCRSSLNRFVSSLPKRHW
jgi:hypothetical protein